MKTAIVTDGKYRSSIAAVRALGRAGYKVVVTQTRKDVKSAPAVCASRYVSEFRWIDGSCSDDDYAEKLMAVLREYAHPVLLCTGAVTLNSVSAHKCEFEELADFLVAEKTVLDALNDKEQVHIRCEELGIKVPKQFRDAPDVYPVVIKPHCGEKFGLKAKDRYAIAGNKAEYEEIMRKMRRYDPLPLVQQKITGDGAGVSMLLDVNGRLVSALCHRRVREYPVSGGPSTCCESFYDEKMINDAYRLLHSFGFVGLAMVEFKGDCVLEVNPRVWGSFPMTQHTESSMTANYAKAAGGEKIEYIPHDFKTGVRMRFILNDAAAVLGLLKAGRIKEAFRGIADFFRVREALRFKGDNKPFWRYLIKALLRR